MTGKPLTRGFSNGLEEWQVVRRGRDGPVAHRGGEDRELRLDIHAGAVPPQQCVDGVGVALTPRAE